MGYSRYWWAAAPTSDDIWSAACRDVRTVMQAMHESTTLTLTDSDGTSAPVVSNDIIDIAVSGHGALVVRRNTERGEMDWCKPGSGDYDLYVALILLVLRHHGVVSALDSDDEPVENGWKNAWAAWHELFPDRPAPDVTGIS